MSDEELIREGKAGRYMRSAMANLGQAAAQVFCDLV
jgi:hypothetical protein